MFHTKHTILIEIERDRGLYYYTNILFKGIASINSFFTFIFYKIFPLDDKFLKLLCLFLKCDILFIHSLINTACLVASCEGLEIPGDVVNPPVLSTHTSTLYGDVITMNCTVDGYGMFQRHRKCLYDFNTSSYAAIGDIMECGGKLR